MSVQGPEAYDGGLTFSFSADTSVDDASVGGSGAEQAAKREMARMANNVLIMGEPVISVDGLSYQAWPLFQIVLCPTLLHVAPCNKDQLALNLNVTWCVLTQCIF